MVIHARRAPYSPLRILSLQPSSSSLLSRAVLLQLVFINTLLNRWAHLISTITMYKRGIHVIFLQMNKWGLREVQWLAWVPTTGTWPGWVRTIGSSDWSVCRLLCLPYPSQTANLHEEGRAEGDAEAAWEEEVCADSTVARSFIGCREMYTKCLTHGHY